LLDNMSSQWSSCLEMHEWKREAHVKENLKGRESQVKEIGKLDQNFARRKEGWCYGFASANFTGIAAVWCARYVQVAAWCSGWFFC